jgi:hypothetical protein
MSTSLIAGIIGAILCLFGFTLYMAGLRVLGMFLGGTIGALVGFIISYYAVREGGVTAIIIILAGAVAGIFLGWRFLKAIHGVVVFIIGGGFGFFLARSVLAPSFGGIWEEPWMPFAAAVVGGILFTVLFRYVIILVTAAFGAYLIFYAASPATGAKPWWVFVIAFLVGLLVQLGLFHRLGLHKRVRASWS